MSNVTKELKEIFSYKKLETDVFENGMENYFKNFKKEIENFLKQNEKMQAKKKKTEKMQAEKNKTEEQPKSDTYNNLKNFADILDASKVWDDEYFKKICKVANLLPRFVLDENGTKRGKISLKASIKKVSKDIKTWAETLDRTRSKLIEIRKHLMKIQKAVELAKDPNKCLYLNSKNWDEIFKIFKESGIKKIEAITKEIDKNIVNNIVNKNEDYGQDLKLLSDWGENETIKNLINSL